MCKTGQPLLAIKHPTFELIWKERVHRSVSPLLVRLGCGPRVSVPASLKNFTIGYPYRGTSDKNPSARGSVGRCFLNSRKPRSKPVGLRFLESRKRTKAVGPRFLKIKKPHESGRSVCLKMRPVRVNVLYGFNTPAPALPPTCALHVHVHVLQIGSNQSESRPEFFKDEACTCTSQCPPLSQHQRGSAPPYPHPT